MEHKENTYKAQTKQKHNANKIQTKHKQNTTRSTNITQT